MDSMPPPPPVTGSNPNTPPPHTDNNGGSMQQQQQPVVYMDEDNQHHKYESAAIMRIKQSMQEEARHLDYKQNGFTTETSPTGKSFSPTTTNTNHQDEVIAAVADPP